MLADSLTPAGGDGGAGGGGGGGAQPRGGGGSGGDGARGGGGGGGGEPQTGARRGPRTKGLGTYVQGPDTSVAGDGNGPCRDLVGTQQPTKLQNDYVFRDLICPLTVSVNEQVPSPTSKADRHWNTYVAVSAVPYARAPLDLAGRRDRFLSEWPRFTPYMRLCP
eukprot:1185078-Prorocentrum_minimum.AAC.2